MRVCAIALRGWFFVSWFVLVLQNSFSPIDQTIFKEVTEGLMQLSEFVLAEGKTKIPTDMSADEDAAPVPATPGKDGKPAPSAGPAGKPTAEWQDLLRNLGVCNIILRGVEVSGRSETDTAGARSETRRDASSPPDDNDHHWGPPRSRRRRGGVPRRVVRWSSLFLRPPSEAGARTQTHNITPRDGRARP